MATRKPTTRKNPARGKKPLGSAGDDELKRAKAKAIRTALYFGTGLLVVGGGILAIKTFYKGVIQETVQNNAETRSSQQGDPGSYAKLLKLAFNPSGFDSMQEYDSTDEDTIYQVLRSIPNAKFYADVVKAYSRLYPGRNLNQDLTTELDAAEFREAKKLLDSLH